MEEIIVVVGVIRSGTSMVMHMLEKGGVECVYNNNRPADEFNRNGYFLNSIVRNLADADSFYEQVNGKAIKLYLKGIQLVPSKFKYKFIFITRDLLECLNSQDQIKKQDKFFNIPNYPTKRIEGISQAITNFEAWVEKSKNIEMLTVDYNSILKSPKESSENIAEFIGRKMDIEAMVSATDPSLQNVKRETLKYKRTDRAPLGLADLINKYVQDKTYCEIGIGEGHLLNKIQGAKEIFGVEEKEYGVKRCQKMYPHIKVLHGDFLKHFPNIKFDVAYLWIVYPSCKKIIDTIFERDPNTIIISGLNYYYHLTEKDPELQEYLALYPKVAKADKWNEYINAHLDELKAQGYNIEIVQIPGDHKDLFSVAIIQK